jgi:Methane oxygenase PmoA
MTTDKQTAHLHQFSRRDFIAAAGAAAFAPMLAQTVQGAGSKDGVAVRLDAGPADRLNEMVSFPINPKQCFDNWREGTSRLALSLANERGETVSEVPCQFEPECGRLSWLTGRLQKGTSASYRIQCINGGPAPAKRYRIEQKPAHLMITVDDALLARYNFLGVWKPYFWPVNGSEGSVVRGAGGGDHPHHTGLYLAYGGHGEGGSANIWSDWDEPPYGPCGKMLHQRFVRLTEGPVYAELVEELIYVKGNGDKILDEKRTVRLWCADNGTRFLDMAFEATPPQDTGKKPFMLVARLAPSMNIPKEGHVENSEGLVGRKEVDHQHARWVDCSGKVGKGINGICLFDHPQNPEYPGLWGEVAVQPQMTLVHHTPDPLPNDRLHLKFRVCVHDGNNKDAQMDTRYQSYVSPVKFVSP